MPSFRRSWKTDPGLQRLSEIESINVIDSPPDSVPLGASVGVVCVVGEFEDGLFESPTRMLGDADVALNFGGFGWEKDGTPYQYPVASQSAGSPAPWGGSGYIALKNKQFSGLILCRVDGSAGEVTFSRLASLTGVTLPLYNLTTGDTLSFSVDGAAAATATFTGTPAALLGVAGTYPTLFTGGETLEISIDGAPTQVITFQAADQSVAQVVSRVNSSVASTVASNSAGQLLLSGLQGGWGGSIEVVGGTARATLGLPTATVQEIDTLTVTGAASSVTWTASFQQVIDGATYTRTATYLSDASATTTEIRDGLLTDWLGQSIPYVTFGSSGGAAITVTADANRTISTPVITPGGAGTGTFTETTAPVVTLTRGTGNVQDIDRVSSAEYVTIVDALTGVGADVDPDGYPRAHNTATPTTGSLEVVVPSTAATAFGFEIGQAAQAGTGGLAGTIPAGTLLRDTTNDVLWITMEAAEVSEDVGGPYTIRVRPAVDDDTAPTCAIGDLDQVVDSLYTGFSCTNAAALSRLSGPQMDARYQAAIDATIDSAGVSHDINIIISARSSAAINRALSQNATDATASGHRHRKAITSPAVGTSIVGAQASTGAGVGANRDRRTMYVFPGMAMQVPEIASLGAAGGTGFTNDGVIDVTSNTFYAAVRSILAPEENAGQQLSDTNYGSLNVVGLEAAYDRTRGGQSLTIQHYIAFKAAGIIAPRPDRVSGMVFQSDVTSVSPVSSPSLVEAKRQFMADFLYDSLQDIAAQYAKKQNTIQRRKAFHASVVLFLELLKSTSQPNTSRLEDYSVKDVTLPAQRAAGFQIFDIKVRTYASMDYIVYRASVGTTVEISAA